MTAGNETSTGVDEQDAVITSTVEASPEAMRPNPLLMGKPSPRIALHPAGLLFSPQESLVWILGLLSAAACIVPWVARGWLWFGLIATAVALLTCYDAIALWLTREECAPVLLQSEKGLRGSEGQTIQISFALTGSGRGWLRNDVRVAIMPTTQAGEAAFWVKSDVQRLKLERPESVAAGSTSTSAAQMQLWPWTAEIALLRRGLWPGPRVGIDRQSRFRIWRLPRWFDVPAPLRIDANLQSGRQEILRSPVYRMLVASQQTPWTGHGREFERLREYQPGDTYSEIAWKSTARRGAPVTRLFQWEQKQEVYFVVDQSRASGLALHQSSDSESAALQGRAARRMLDLAVETAMVGATVALELGDEFGLVTYADGAKSWLRAGSGQSQFHRFRDCLLSLEPLPTNADYEALFSGIRIRLRRRAYLVLLADLTERSISDSLRRGVGLVRSSHALLMTSVLPPHVRPAFSPRQDLNTDQDVYAALAGDREHQRFGALARQLRQLDVKLRFIPAEKFLRTAVEGYLEGKREQRL
ncbi:MAG TPA: DUF58 domain-containing protein [Terriglobales bacterium]|jgi:uncharacterized protein (DUF58 family)|nr:DUF58 domain-containing protein [Terriglobales bacterium]